MLEDDDLENSSIEQLREERKRQTEIISQLNDQVQNLKRDISEQTRTHEENIKIRNTKLNDLNAMLEIVNREKAVCNMMQKKQEKEEEETNSRKHAAKRKIEYDKNIANIDLKCTEAFPSTSTEAHKGAPASTTAHTVQSTNTCARTHPSVRTGPSTSTVSEAETEARIIALICLYLNNHPSGENIEKISNFVQQKFPIEAEEVEAILLRFRSVFNQSSITIDGMQMKVWKPIFHHRSI